MKELVVRACVSSRVLRPYACSMYVFFFFYYFPLSSCWFFFSRAASEQRFHSLLSFFFGGFIFWVHGFCSELENEMMHLKGFIVDLMHLIWIDAGLQARPSLRLYTALTLCAALSLLLTPVRATAVFWGGKVGDSRF